MARSKHSLTSVSRRQFLAATAAGAACLAAPAIVTADKSGNRTITGQGDYQFEVNHDWAQLPDKYSWQTTHNVAVDRDNNLYVIHEGTADKSDHPSIFVFDAEGRFVRAFGQQFQGGGHGIEVRDEGGEQFLYVAAYQQIKSIAKLDLKGETVWQRWAPMASGVYAAGEDTAPKKEWGRDRFMPTNFAFLPDGDFFVADGYGAFYIHRYDREGNWKSCFGGPGAGQGKFNTPHGIWIDDRGEGEPTLVVADRANNTLQVLTLAGEHLRTIDGFGLPANIDRRDDLLLVPELVARVSLLDKNNHVVATLGDDVERLKADANREIRRDSSRWQDGRFVHPHDACFDRDGNIFVAEWVATGRVSKLVRMG
ncbi:MAG: twin-arginine translocation signal domain-containing protein [Planctomycetales bacterium]|nr:twin-arginine translocation signal domain-containing protein [Planctomycetales bacterium]